MKDAKGFSDLGSRSLLGTLFDTTISIPGGWSPEDLGGMLEHQLSTPIRLEADQVAGSTPKSAEALTAFLESAPDVTFLEVLEAGNPHHGALTLIKDFGKETVATGEPLPREVGRVLYVASILRARAAGATDFSALPHETVTREARRCLTYAWLPQSMRALLRKGLEET